MTIKPGLLDELIAVIRKHYPDGKVPTGDAIAYWGLMIAVSVANQPEDVRDRAARELAKIIRYPDKVLKEYGL